MAMNSEIGGAKTGTRPASTSWWNDPKIRGAVLQGITLALVVLVLYIAISNASTNLSNRNIARGYNFLGDRAGFGVVQSLIDFPKEATYGRALLVGFLNTILVAVIGVIGATILGFLAGIARLSKNLVISSIATVYVETIRNVPLLLQMLFWYFGVLGFLPIPKNSLEPVKGMIYINNRGLIVPGVSFGDITGWAILAGFILGIAAAVVVSKWAAARQMRTGRQFPVLWVGLALIVGLPILGFLVTGANATVSFPVKSTFNLNGGARIIPELVALALSLTIYTGVYIAEIVRSGILSVSHGQTEACHALGLSSGQALRLVIIPQALRVILPPLTNQYLNVTKNSSLATAIAYPDLVYVGGTVLNQSGQALEVISIWMVVYLGISIVTAIVMNWYNSRVAIVER